MAFSTGWWPEVQQPLATVVIGGVISAMIMSLLVLHSLYMLLMLPPETRTRVSVESERLHPVGAGSV